MAALFLIGCTQQASENTGTAPSAGGVVTATPAASTESAQQANTSPASTASQSSVTGAELFKYSNTLSYTYKKTFTAYGQTTTSTMSTAMKGIENVDGVTAKHEQVSISGEAMGGKTLVYHIWREKETNKCLKTEMEFEGQRMKYDCSQANDGAGVPEGTTYFTSTGAESVTVPAGTFTATIYSNTITNDGKTVMTSKYWKADNVPVPVKWITSSSEGGSTTGELVSFTP
ncbi:MAG: hypothetical protein ACPL4N_01375 [Candidatus Norongarragalinales archaeon]